MTAVNQKTLKNEMFQTKNLTKTAVLGVLAFIIMFVEFPLPMFPPF